MEPDISELRSALHLLDLRLARIEERITQEAVALKLQYEEYHRRLDELNHAAHTRALRDQEFVNMDKHQALEHKLESMIKELRGTFDMYAKQTSEKFEATNTLGATQHETVLKTLTDISGQRLGAMTTRDTTMRIITIVVSVGAIIAMILLAYLR